jgi:Na+/proline symporter/signal transduction histidine kinase
MFSGWLLSAIAVAYLGCLFGIAYAGERGAWYPQRARLRPYIYALALGVYCTTWTFFGAVGTAVRDGWEYLPIYLGPMVVFLLAVPILRRMVAVAQANQVASIADFIAARFGKSPGLGALVALIALTATVPYLSLQYRAVATSIAVLTGAAGTPMHWYRDTALAVALLMALFAVLFGARRVEATERHGGLMLAIAFESLVKLLAFAAIGIFAWLHLPPGELRLPPQLASAEGFGGASFLGTTLLAALAIVCLPRQFQVGVVECAEPADLGRARWLFPLYLLAFSLLVVPIVMAGAAHGLTASGSSDMLVLALPMALQAPGLALLVYVGGLSAATAMVVVASIALSTMISNNIAVPALWRQRLEAGDHLRKRVLWLRRAVIFGIALLAYGYYRVAANPDSLAAIGVLAFAAVAQFAPGLLAALYWRGAAREGVFWGLAAGFAFWFYTMLLPNFLAHSPPLGGSLLAGLLPTTGGGAAGLGGVARGGVVALALNALVLVVVSLVRGTSLQERTAARSFLALRTPRQGLPPITAKVADLESVAARVLGADAARQALSGYAAQSGRAPFRPGESADRELLQHVERLLAGSIGAASARVMLTHALRRKGLGVDEVAELLDETSQELRFSRRLLEATMDNVTQGISVIDTELRLVAWNRRYVELFDYPASLVQIGRPVAELIRWNAERGGLGPGDPEEQVARRLRHLRAGTPYTLERARPDGRVLSIHGEPMDGGYVSTYTDITDFKRTEQALREAKLGLEASVEQRTQELRVALEAQRAAKQQAEEANVGKTRFFAAASHDLLQPLNAARLFASSLEAEASGEPRFEELASRIDSSLRAAEELLSGLLDVARLDSGALRPEIESFAVAGLLDDLFRQYTPVAAARGLRLEQVACSASVRSDRVLLRRIVQNYLANALRYTQQGGVLLGCRRRPGGIEIVVCDTGPGIAAHERRRIYAEFSRLGERSPWGEQGLGLGLAICERIARLLGHELTLGSQVGRGSQFGVRVPTTIAPALAQADAPVPAPAVASPTGLAGLRVLCVDNDLAILDGMRMLLGRWGLIVQVAASADAARALLADQPFDVVLADYHLGGGMNGLELLQCLLREARAPLAAALITADHGADLEAAARTAGLPLLRKPLRPAALRALLASMRIGLRRSPAA